MRPRRIQNLTTAREYPVTLKILKMFDLNLVTIEDSQSSRENATPSSGTSPLAYY